jgi:hypothetical protein
VRTVIIRKFSAYHLANYRKIYRVMGEQSTRGHPFLRILLLLMNGIFILLGLSLIGVGIYVKVDTNLSAVLNKLANVSSFETQSLGFFAIVMIVGGVFTIFIAFLGCAGKSLDMNIDRSYLS